MGIRVPTLLALPILIAFLVVTSAWAKILGRIPIRIRNVFALRGIKKQQLRLITIHFSHFCEKARWALDLCNEEYVEDCQAPLTHRWATQCRTEGKSSSTPLLIVTNPDNKRKPIEVFAESTDILQWLAAKKGNEWLYPNKEVLELENYFNQKLGPAVRRVAYYHGMDKQKDSLQPLFLQEVRSFWQRQLVSLFYPTVVLMMKKSMRINKEGCDRSEEALYEVLGKVAGILEDGRKYLCNTERPTAADISLAAFLAPLVGPPETEELLRQYPVAESLREYMKKVRESPAGQFTLRLYKEARGTKSVKIKHAKL